MKTKSKVQVACEKGEFLKVKRCISGDGTWANAEKWQVTKCIT
jgi:hypothetical protein